MASGKVRGLDLQRERKRWKAGALIPEEVSLLGEGEGEGESRTNVGHPLTPKKISRAPIK